MDQLLEPSKRNDKSLNQDNDLNKNCVSNSTLNPPNLNPKFPSLPKMRGFKIAFLNICSLTCHYDELCVFMEDRTIDVLVLTESKLDWIILFPIARLILRDTIYFVVIG